MQFYIDHWTLIGRLCIHKAHYYIHQIHRMDSSDGFMFREESVLHCFFFTFVKGSIVVLFCLCIRQ